MKKIATLTLFCFSLLLKAQTSVPGGIVTGNWTLAGSPYLVQGSIQVPDGFTLTINPGVKVEFQGTYKMLVHGQLIAVGTPTDSITFTAANKGTGWRSIRFDMTNSTNDTSRLSYCRIKYGRATGSSPDDNGGALYFANFSKAVISNCRIDSCMANTNGGGIYLSNSSPRIWNNTLTRDTAKYGAGGAIYTSGADITLYNNVITSNVVTGFAINSHGGGVFIGGGNVVISNNTITGNSAFNVGAGIYDYANVSLVSNNTISNNSTPGSAGGIFLDAGAHQVDGNLISDNTANRGGGIMTYTTPLITNNIITNNRAIFSSGNNGDGGAVYLYNASPTLDNNVICNNEVMSASGHGGAIYCNNNSNPTITNCTISNNAAPVGGALYCTSACDPVFRNTILWGNTATTVGPQVALDDEPSDPAFTYCDVEGGSAAFDVNGNFYTGSYLNNINNNPFFIAASGGSGVGFNGTAANWAVQNSSLCIDAGDPSGSYPATDITGNPRISGNFIDIGAYEAQGITSVPVSVSKNRALVFPNPATTEIAVSINGKQGELVMISIFDQLGALVKKETVHIGYGKLDVTSLESGLFTLVINCGSEVQKQKLVIQK